jgi:DNA-binding XRE family transcriptional regulator
MRYYCLMDIKVKIGLRIKELRTDKNLTQEEVAWKADVDRTFMNHVENGKRNASVDTLTKIICNGLDSNFKDFFNSESFNGKKRGK